MNCEDIRIELGAYVLGTLEPADEQRVEAHLASCPECLAEVEELTSVVPALATVSAHDVQTPTLPADLFDRIVTAVDEPTVSPMHHRRRWLVAVAASVLVLAGAGAAIGVATSSSHSTLTSATGTAGRISLGVQASDISGGTRLRLTAMGLPTRERCHLVALAADGTHHDAGTWTASYEGKAALTETTDVARSQIRQLDLYGDDGQVLVTVPA